MMTTYINITFMTVLSMLLQITTIHIIENQEMTYSSSSTNQEKYKRFLEFFYMNFDELNVIELESQELCYRNISCLLQIKLCFPTDSFLWYTHPLCHLMPGGYDKCLVALALTTTTERKR